MSILPDPVLGPPVVHPPLRPKQTTIDATYIQYVKEVALALTGTIKLAIEDGLTPLQVTHTVAAMLADPGYVSKDETKGRNTPEEHIATLAALAAVLLTERI